jgi:hypothetical protein
VNTNTLQQVQVRLTNDGRSWLTAPGLDAPPGDRALHALLRQGWHVVDVEAYDGYESLVILERDN